MDKKEIVNLFMNKGLLLTPSALSFLEEKSNDIIELLSEKKYEKDILTEADFRLPSIIILKNITQIPREITTEDFISYYTDKYEKMKAIITERIKKDFISLNKIDNFRNEVYVIGIVKEIKQKDDKTIVEIEDLTTSVPIIFEEKVECELDDVIAVHAVSAKNIMFGKKIIYPDVPIRQPTKGFGSACFISDLHLDEAPIKDFLVFVDWFNQQKIDYLFVAGDIGDLKAFEEAVKNIHTKTFVIPGNADDKEYPGLPLEFSSKNIVSLSNPSIIEVNGIKVLIIHDKNDVMTMLKKRHLGKPTRIFSKDYLVLDIVPDIVHYGHTHEPFVTNHKAVTFVNSGSLLSSFKPVVINFENRNVEQINFKAE